MKALQLRVGVKAAQRLEKEGWHADLIDGLIGASGGPKWLILGRLDRVLISELLSERSRPLDAVGSSIGAWRHAAMAQPDPLATYDRFEQAYLSQHYASAKPTVPEITEVALWLMRTLLGDEGEHYVADHPWLRSHIVTARGRGLNGRQPGKRLVAGMGIAALGNALSRATLRASFQRVVFASRGAEPLTPLFDGFGTRYIDLAKSNVFSALMASGAIPYVFEGVYDIDGAGKGAFWDGGIIDYHFDLKRLPEDEVWLYPHFSSRTTVGWFDKFLPWRADRQVSADQLIMICPSDAFLEQLPFGKIPDRRDFGKIPEPVRETYWRHCVNESHRLADEFHELINGPDPLAGALRF
ncbi:MAG: patatin-like phospholipase family protein [Luminiphilus sp.]|nr:patatin-like phospholipase family protein [Luminiphilus sp.]